MRRQSHQGFLYGELRSETTRPVSAACWALMAISVIRHPSWRVSGGGASPCSDRANCVNMSVCGLKRNRAERLFGRDQRHFLIDQGRLDDAARAGDAQAFVAMRRRGLRAQIVECHRRHATVSHGQHKGRLAAAGRESRGESSSLSPHHLGEYIAEDPVQPVKCVNSDPRRQAGKRLAAAVKRPDESCPICRSSG